MHLLLKKNSLETVMCGVLRFIAANDREKCSEKCFFRVKISFPILAKRWNLFYAVQNEFFSGM